jgi:hypothetical protein
MTPTAVANAHALRSWSIVMVRSLRFRVIWMPKKSSGSPSARMANMEATNSTNASASATVRAATTPFDDKPTAKQANSSSPLPQNSPPQAASSTHTHHVYADT